MLVGLFLAEPWIRAPRCQEFYLSEGELSPLVPHETTNDAERITMVATQVGLILLRLNHIQSTVLGDLLCSLVHLKFILRTDSDYRYHRSNRL